MSNEHKKVTRAAGITSAATSISRLLGLIRDMTIANFFGISAVSSAFSFAFRIPNLLRRLFGEGAMASAFIPLFAAEIHNNDLDSGYNAANIVLTLLAALLAAIAMVIGAVCLFLALFVFDDFQWQLAMLLTVVMIPYCVFICLTAVCGAMLNTLGHFSRPALAPVLLNISIITFVWLGAFFLGKTHDKLIYTAAIGVLIGGVAQLAFQIPELRKRGFRFKLAWNLTHPFVRNIYIIMAPAVLGAGITQINVMVDGLLAMFINERGVSVLFFANRLTELPLGIFGVAIATAVLPSLSFFAAKNEKKGFVNAVGFALRYISFIIIPAAVGLMILGEPIVRLIFQYGEFTAESTGYVVSALRLYAPGLMAFAMLKIVVPTFYALKDTKTPVKVGLATLVLNVILNVILMQFMAERGLALSTTICAYINVSLLLFLLRKKMGPLGMKKVAGSIVKIGVTTIIMGWMVWGTLIIIQNQFPGDDFIDRFLKVIIPIVLGLIIYIVIAFITGQRELKELLSAYLRKK